MKNAKTWFLNLSKIGKLSILASLAFSGLFFASAMAVPTDSAVESINTTESGLKKEAVVTYETEIETVPIPFTKSTREDSTLDKGKTNIETIGVNGEKTIVYTVTITDGVETNRKSEENITKEPINEVVVTGTYIAPKYIAPAVQKSSCDPNYGGGCVPNVSYDLDCADIGFSLNVIGSDMHGFDRDGDGVGCESY